MGNNKIEHVSSEVVKYDVVALNGKERELTFFDSELIEHTKRIQKYRDAGNLAVLAIASELDAMEADNSYAKAGFKTVAEYAQVVFDYKPATVSLYLRSARAFLEKSDNADMPVNFKGNIPHLTVGQMIELLPLVKNETDISEVEEAFADSTINQRMSTKDLRKAVASIRGISTTAKGGKEEKSALEQAAKLGSYNKDKLPKGKTSEAYALTSIDATLQAFDNFVAALKDVEHNDTLDAKVDSITAMLQEIRAEITK